MEPGEDLHRKSMDLHIGRRAGTRLRARATDLGWKNILQGGFTVLNLQGIKNLRTGECWHARQMRQCGLFCYRDSLLFWDTT